MPNFEIQTYKVSAQLQRFPGEIRRSRLLDMTGPVLAHGIQNRAYFMFSDFFRHPSDQPYANQVVGYTYDGGFSGQSVAGWFPADEFEYYYDIVRSERPISVRYTYKEGGKTSGNGYLQEVGLGTNVEPIGEGPAESLPTFIQLMAERLESRRPVEVPLAVKDIVVGEEGEEAAG